MNALDASALLVSAYGLLAGAAVLVSVRRLRPALAAALELWTAAGLLRLSAERSWAALAGAAAVLLLRRMVSLGLGRQRA